MTLKKYKEKRSFESTPEPKPIVKRNSKLPVFCVQLHDASHLHYDFRLEYCGILLSWAVPKGPSLNPLDKRLAIQVEDHPFDYRTFEGIIPKGNYGAGTVMLWDEGFFALPKATNKKEMEKLMEAGLKKGHLEFVLNGHKLKGSFSLIKMKTTENQWLLIKGKDEYASKIDLEELGFSVKTERSLDEIRGSIRLRKKIKASLPGFISPMLCTLIAKPFSDPDWLFETKWDGYRTLAYVDKNVHLYSRKENSFDALFSLIVKDLKKLKAQCVLDGEVVVLDKKGKSDFQLMQNFQRTQEGELYYYVFDLLFLNGQDLRNEPLIKRKELLKALLENFPLERTRYSDHIEDKGILFFKEVKKNKLEGMIAKKKQSSYQSKRGREWLKIKTHCRQEAVIIGFTAPRASHRYFGALLLGVYDSKKQLTYIGHVGTGFTQGDLKEIYEMMQPLVQQKSPLKEKVVTNMPATWIKPRLVCELSFTEWTNEGMMRHPVFEGIRVDKDAQSIHRELENEK